MNTTTAIVVLSVTLATSAMAQCPPVKGGYRYVHTTTDRFSGVKTSKTNFKPGICKDVGCEGRLPPTMANFFVLTSPEGVTTYGTIFTRMSAGAQYKDCFATFILSDDKRVATLDTVYHGGDSSGGSTQQTTVRIPVGRLGLLGVGFTSITPDVTAESVTVTLDAKAAAQLGAARKIEFKICNDESVASPEFVLAAREFACKVAAAESASTPTPSNPPPPS